MNRKKSIVFTVLLTIILSFMLMFTQDLSAAPRYDYNTVSSRYFRIKVVDSATKRGIPIVELKTTNNITYYTDSAGYVAFYESGLMNKDVFFHIYSHGHEYPDDSLGAPGVVLKTVPGEEAVIELNRINIAERLYRITGQGIYRDSILLGLDTPLEKPLLNGKVMGQDSNLAVVYNNKIYWFWGDTLASFNPLGNFRATGATSELPENGGLHPSVGVNLHYFTKSDGFVKEMVPKRPQGNNYMLWLSGTFTALNVNGVEKLVSGYAEHADLTTVVDSGLVIWNDDENAFTERIPMDMNLRWKHPRGHAFKYTEEGREYWMFACPWPVLRVPNYLPSIRKLENYEVFTCLKPGTEFKGKDTELNRDKDGNLIWEWRKDTKPINQQQERELFEYGLLKEDELRFQLVNVDDGKSVDMHNASVQYNAYRDKWIMIFIQNWGSSMVGEIWYAEAPAPTGPWKYTKKIMTHRSYDFYNVIHHPFFDEDNGRLIYFEGTYTASFGGSVKNPRYNYNQVMCRLDLADPRLKPLFEKSDETTPSDETPTPSPSPEESPEETPAPTQMESPEETPQPTMESPTEAPTDTMESPAETPAPTQMESPAETIPETQETKPAGDENNTPKTGDPTGHLASIFAIIGLILCIAVLHFNRNTIGRGVKK